MPTILGNQLKVARSVRGVTQVQLANALGTRQSLISAWESGKSLPSLTSLYRVAVALNMDLSVNMIPRPKPEQTEDA